MSLVQYLRGPGDPVFSVFINTRFYSFSRFYGSIMVLIARKLMWPL